MKTTATNRKIGVLMRSLENKTLLPSPKFQRRLVWNNKDKNAFLETVLSNYPFPEIYVAAGDVDLNSGEVTELLVDGQQRITTLYQYFTGSEDIALIPDIRPYLQLSDLEKKAFLEYEVVVRDLGNISIEEIQHIFRKINSTSYSLNAMEIANSRYQGEFKSTADDISELPFFEMHRIFSSYEVRRMQDTRFILTLIATMLSTYFNRDEEIEDFLLRYNDDFPMKNDIKKELDVIFSFIDDMTFDTTSRIWKKADLFTAIVELHNVIYKRHKKLSPKNAKLALNKFYLLIDNEEERSDSNSPATRYHKAALQATNDKVSRAIRGSIIGEILENIATDGATTMKRRVKKSR